MLALGVVTDVRVQPGRAEAFLVATRIYRQQTYAVAPRARFEIFRDPDQPGAFVIQQMFPDEASLTAQLEGEHFRRWEEAVTPMLQGEPVTRRLATLLGERLSPSRRPPPLPVRPSVETAANLPNTRAPSALSTRWTHARITVTRIEMAAAVEGAILRGEPDPCLVIGYFVVEDGRARCLGRALYRFRVGNRFPLDLSPDHVVLNVPTSADGTAIRSCVVVVLGFEENGGTDVRAAYQDLGEASELVIWQARELEPSPVSLADYAVQVRSSDGEAVQLARDGGLVGASSADDTWVGAAAAVVELGAAPRYFHARLASDDRKNDWNVTLRLGSAAITRT